MREDTKYMQSIYEMYAVNELSDAVIFKVVKKSENKPKEYTIGVLGFIKEMVKSGLKHSGFNKNHRQREELQNKPIFSNANGPMYDGIKDGKAVIRYEID